MIIFLIQARTQQHNYLMQKEKADEKKYSPAK